MAPTAAHANFSLSLASTGSGTVEPIRSAPPKRAKSRTYFEAMKEYSDEQGMKSGLDAGHPPVHLGLLELGLGVGCHPEALDDHVGADLVWPGPR